MKTSINPEGTKKDYNYNTLHGHTNTSTQQRFQPQLLIALYWMTRER